MIFAMVGMHDRGFNRLIHALDSYAGDHQQCEVLIQIGFATFEPVHARFFRFKEDLSAEIARADIVISHGSVCVFEALARGKPVIMVPRKAEFSEVIDNHQIEFSKRLGTKYNLPVILDEKELCGVIDRQLHHLCSANSDTAPSRFNAPPELCLQINKYLAG